MINLPQGIPLIVDQAVAVMADFAVGANEDGYHYFGVNWQRDAHFTREADLRNAQPGDLAPNGTAKLATARGIEVGHIFQLGQKYSAAMNLKVLQEDGSLFAPLMGCYGIGVSRIVAAAIEQNHDERGIIWPGPLAPFQLVICPINGDKSPAVQGQAEELYRQLLAAGVEVLLDDRQRRPGVMFADMDLLGIPQRLVISDKTLAAGEVEYKRRTDSEARRIPLAEVLNTVL